jgi:hypothetical protein
MAQARPLIEEPTLNWPPGVPRRADPASSQYGNWTWPQVLDELEAELRRLGATDITVSHEVPRRGKYPDPAIVVYFSRAGSRFVLPADKWSSKVDNLHSISLWIAALRAQERGGIAQVVDRTLSGFRALPPPPPPEEPWRKVLRCPEDVTINEAEVFYRARAREAHPDAGGSADQMGRLNRAIERARAELRPRPPEASP